MTVDGSSMRGPSRPGSSLTGRALILGLVVVTLGVALSMPLRSWFAQRAEIADLRAGVEAARERVAALQDQKARWEDPTFVAAQARSRLHFVLPGEIGFVTLGLDTVTHPDEAQAAASRAWYDSLWRSVQRADDKPAGTTAPAPVPLTP